jgi:hypothetical protein
VHAVPAAGYGHSNAVRRSISPSVGEILSPVLEFGGARVRIVRHIVGGFERAAVLQEHGDARAPEGVVADALRKLGLRAAFLDDPEHIAARERQAGQPVIFVGGKEGQPELRDLFTFIAEESRADQAVPLFPLFSLVRSRGFSSFDRPSLGGLSFL